MGRNSTTWRVTGLGNRRLLVAALLDQVHTFAGRRKRGPRLALRFGEHHLVGGAVSLDDLDILAVLAAALHAVLRHKSCARAASP